MRVLIAEDDAIVRRLAVRVLTERGHECLVASSAEELERLALALPPDAVVSDIDLGDGDGIAACLRLRERSPAVPVLFMTGDPASAARAEQAGFGAALLKPFTLAELEQALARIGARCGADF